MMRAMCILAGSVLLLAGCAGPLATPTQTSALPSDYFRPDNPELSKIHKAQINPAIGEAQVKEAVQARLNSLSGISTVIEMKVEIKDAQWTKDNLGHEQQLFTLDSPVWVVQVAGDFAPPDSGAPRYKSSTFVVDVEFGSVILMTLKR